MAKVKATAVALQASPYAEAVAIIDIGSNSVRLVVYDGLKRSPVALLNDKAQCGLGRGLEESGRLNPESKRRTHQAVQRFVTLLELMRVKQVVAVATAAVRDAADGPVFARELEEGTSEFPKGIRTTLGARLTILSGDEEARLSALGVTGSMTGVSGVVGDLGGGSLELTEAQDGTVGRRVSVPIGHFRLMSLSDASPRKALKLAERELAAFVGKAKRDPQPFYAVGGGFRAIAKLHQQHTGYPLRVIHQYQVPAGELVNLLGKMMEAKPDELKAMPGMSGERLETVPYAAAVLRAVISRLVPSEVVFSADGVREGVLLDRLPVTERVRDPLLASAQELAARAGCNPDYAAALERWLKQALGGVSPQRERLVKALCILSEAAWAEHPEYRAVYALERALEYPFMGITHPERAFLGVALYHRHKNKLSGGHAETASALLTPAQLKEAALLGYAAGLAAQLSAVTVEGLAHAELVVEEGRVGVLFKPGYASLMGEKPRKLLDRIAGLLGAEVISAG